MPVHKCPVPPWRSLCNLSGLHIIPANTIVADVRSRFGNLDEQQISQPLHSILGQSQQDGPFVHLNPFMIFGVKQAAMLADTCAEP